MSKSIPSKVLYVSYDGMTDPLGQSQVLPYISKIEKYGFKYTLISCEKEENYEKYKDSIKAFCEKENIDWHPVKYTKSPPILSTVWDTFQIMRKAKILHKEKGFDLVHCRSYIPSIVGLR